MKRALWVASCAACSAPAPTPSRPIESVAPVTHAPVLVVGGPGGLAQIDGEGRAVKVLSVTPTKLPRWTPDHRALVFVSESGEVRRLELATGVESVIARLPASVEGPCAGVRVDRTKLHVQEPDDFGFEDAAGAALCVRMTDRTFGYYEHEARFRIELATGKLDAIVLRSACPAGDPPTGPAVCTSVALRTVRSPIEAPRAYAIELGELTLHGAPVSEVGAKRDYGEESVSPSGHWSVVGGGVEIGDYVHRSLFLFDRDAGKLYPIPTEGAGWPPPVARSELPALDSGAGRTLDAIGETMIAWIGDGDLLQIGQLLIQPGVRITPLAGDLAR